MDDPTLFADLRAKSKLIHHLKSRRDRGDFKSVNDALALQRAEREAQRLRDQLPPLRLVSSSGDARFFPAIRILNEKMQ